jgi:hypothetical protein
VSIDPVTASEFKLGPEQRDLRASQTPLPPFSFSRGGGVTGMTGMT